MLLQPHRRFLLSGAIILAIAYTSLALLWLAAMQQGGGTVASEWAEWRIPAPLLKVLTGIGAALAALAGWRWFRRPPAAGGPTQDVSPGYSVRMLLALLTLATALPLMLLVAFHVRQTTGAEIAQANQFVTHLAEIHATDVEGALANFEQVATVLAQRPQVRVLDPAQCEPRLAEVLRTYPLLANVGTVGLDGQAACSAVAPQDGRLANIGNPAWLDTLRRTGRFVVGAPQRGLYTGRYIAVLAYPIRDDSGNVSGAVQLVLNLESFLPLVTKALPKDGVAGILNSDGTVVARSFRPAEMVGRNVRGIGVNNAILERRHGTEASTGADGVERFYAFQPIGNYGWFAVVGVPTEGIYGEARRNAWRNGLVSLAVAALSLLLVLLIHRKIAAPMVDLRGAAERVANGALDERAAVSGPLEVADVARGFNQMLDKLLTMEGRLHDTEAQYRILFDASPDAIRVICEDRIVMMNPAALRLFGLPDGKLDPDKSVFDYIHPSFRDRARERLREVIDERKAVPADERRLIHTDGTEIDVEVLTLPVTYQGKPAALSIVHDVTVRKAAENAMRDVNAELERRVQTRTVELTRANAELEAFSYTIAHDLRAPLRAMNGFARLLLDGQSRQLDEEGRSFVNRIVSNAATMNALLEGLLKLTHLSRVEPALASVDLSDLAGSVVDELRAGEPGRNIEVRVQEGLQATADAQLIRDVLENLIGNAWKYTSRTAAPVVEFGATRVDGVVTYFVRDNGAGFDARYADKLFKTFQRLHKLEEFAGTGIGLASVKRIIEHHNGRVWAEGVVNHGATFYFTLNAG